MVDKRLSVDWNDEEVEKEFTNTVYGCEPSAAEITRLYEALAEDGALPIVWKWEFGRRVPTPPHSDSEREEEEEVVEAEKVDYSGFDLDDEPAPVMITPLRTPGSAGPRGSARKKTTNFETVLASARRMRKLELWNKS